MNKRKTALTLLTVVAALGLVSSVLEPVFSPKSKGRSPGHGAVKTVGVGIYEDSNLTDTLSSINWGMIDPGVSQNYTCHVRNEGNSAAVLSLATTNWNPIKASAFISLSWDYAGKFLLPNEVIDVTFTLSVSPNVSGVSNFSFDTVISSSST